MWIPVWVEFTNLFSHAHSKFHFKTGEMTMMLGINEEEEGADSNGAGKSTVIEAITLAIIGEVYREVGKIDYIRDEQDKCEVGMYLQNPVLKQTMLIRRKIFASSTSAKVQVFENDSNEPVGDLINPNKANAYILERIGVTKEDFLNYFVIGQGNSSSFFSSGDAEQKKIISRFSNFNDIEKMVKELSVKEKEFDDKIIAIEKDMASVDGLIEYLEAEKEETRDKHANELSSKKEKLQRQIDDQKRLIKTYELNVTTSETQITKKTQESKILLKKLQNLGTIDKVNEDIAETEENRKIAMRDALDCQELLSKLFTLKGQTVTCPKCNTPFIPKSEMTPEEVLETIEGLEAQKEELNSEIVSHNETYDQLKSKRGEIREASEERKRLDLRLKSLNEELSSNKNKKETATAEITALTTKMSNLKSASLTELLKPITSKLREKEDEKLEFEKKLQGLKQQKAENSSLLYHFGTKGFKTFLANKSIRTIQDMCNFYLKKFETNIQILINGYTVLKSGEVRDKIEVQILKNGIKKGVFKRYSGGEGSRVKVCGILAINRLINNTAEYGKGLDLLCLDENISYLDATGQNEIIKILANSSITTILVLHNIGDKPYKNKVYVKKEKSISTIL